MRSRAKSRARKPAPELPAPPAAQPDGLEHEPLEADGDALVEAGSESEAPRLEEPLAAQLPVFEQFFKTFGFKRVHGRIWGLLVLSGQPLSAREISLSLGLSQGAT